MVQSVGEASVQVGFEIKPAHFEIVVMSKEQYEEALDKAFDDGFEAGKNEVDA